MLRHPILSVSVILPLTLAWAKADSSSPARSPQANIPSKASYTPLLQRQVVISVVPNPVAAPSSTSSSSFNWWPYPAIESPTTTSTTSTTNAIIFPPASFGSVTPVFSSTSSSSTATSSGASPSSSSAMPTQTMEAATKTSPLKAVDFVPAIVAVAVFLTGLLIWLIQGCCTRKPRVRGGPDDDGVLVCGPPYVGIALQDTARPDVEERGHEYGYGRGNVDDMHKNPKYGIELGPGPGRRELGRSPPDQQEYRWPSFSEQPTFDPSKGFHVPDEHHDEHDPFLSARLFAPEDADLGPSKARRKSKVKVKAGHISRASTVKTTGALTQPSSPQFSDNTSVALQELYESDEEEEAKRKAREAPWESLRHKSIRRGIIEQVKKENKWMDSIRGSLAAGSALFASGSQQAVTDNETNVLLTHTSGGDSRRKRHGHVRQDSDAHLDRDDEEMLACSPLSVRNPSSGRLGTMGDSTSTSPTFSPPGIRRRVTPLKHEIDKYTPVPAKLHDGRSATSPVRSRTRDHHTPIAKDILPENPAQIMSPPLESQMCFTPMPSSTNQLGKSPKPLRPKSKSRVTAAAKSPTRIPIAATPTSGRKKGSSSSSSSSQDAGQPLPFPASESAVLPRADAFRGRLVKKASASPAGKKSGGRLRPSKSKSTSASASRAQETAPVKEDAHAMKKIERIMEHGWVARDMGREDMRCLSPNAFGKGV